MELVNDSRKVLVTKSEQRRYRETKWEVADEILSWARGCGIEAVMFDRSQGTPHLRIAGLIDYWPATTRFVLLKTRLWGKGWGDAKAVLFETMLRS